MNKPLPTIGARVGERVRARRLALAMTCKEADERCGWAAQGRTSKIERGEHVTLANLNALAAVLGISLKELIP